MTTQRCAYRHLCARAQTQLDTPPAAAHVDPLQSEAKVGELLTQSAWQKQTLAQQTKEQIELDVQRLEYGDAAMHASLVQLLFVWSYIHSDLGYRQGMHEVVAFLWHVRQCDAYEWKQAAVRAGAAQPHDSYRRRVTELTQHLAHEDLACLFSQHEIEADTFFLASNVLHRLLPYFSGERSGSPALLKAILYRVDPQLACHLLTLRLDWQPVLLRWQRLLYLHEFDRTETLHLWDTWFPLDPQLELMQYISAAMVLRHRQKLMEGTYAEVMHDLMHYADAHHTSEHLVQQADALRATPTPDMGASIAAQNWSQPPPEPTVAAKAREQLYEMTGLSAQRLVHEIAHLAPFQRKASNAPSWSPKTEDRLRTQDHDKDTQRRRAMLSLDDA